MLIERTKTNPQEIIDFKLAKPTATFSFDNAFKVEESKWLLGFIKLQLFNSVFNKTEESITFHSSPLFIGLIL